MKSISGRNPDEYLADSGRNARRGFGLHSLRSVGAKIYAIIALCFLTFVGVDAYQMWSAKLGLESQRRTEIKHLTEVARAAVQEEYAASQAGSISVEEARERAAARIAGLRYGEDGYFWIADHSKLVMLPPRPDLNGRDLREFKDPHGKEILVEANKVASRDGQGYIDYEWPRPGQSRPVPKITYVVAFEPWGWAIGSGAYIDDIHAQIWAQVKQDLTILLLGLIACGAITFLVARGLSRALRSIAAVTGELAKGNFAVKVPGADRTDEIGKISRAMQRMTANLHATAEVADAIAQGDLTVEAKPLSDKDTLGLAQQRMVEKLQNVVRDALAAAGNVSSGSQEMSLSANVLSAGASEQASAAQEASSAMEEMASNIKQNASNASQTEKIARQSAAGRRIERRGCGPRRAGHADNRPEDHHRAGDRAPDRSAGPERGGRSGACRRARPWLRGGGLRGAKARRAQPDRGGGDRRAFGPDRDGGPAGRRDADQARARHQEDRRSWSRRSARPAASRMSAPTRSTRRSSSSTR